jgi:hypothetical protein
MIGPRRYRSTPCEGHVDDLENVRPIKLQGLPDAQRPKLASTGTSLWFAGSTERRPGERRAAMATESA